jgi:hypothetical protein
MIEVNPPGFAKSQAFRNLPMAKAAAFRMSSDDESNLVNALLKAS